MPIHLITGLPGDGKTTTMVDLLLKKAEQGDRPLFYAGIDGLKPGIATPLEDPTQWESCPDGSLIFIDEAWKWFGHLHNASRQATPPHVLALAEHRHKGIDFVWTTQGPGQLYPFARTLIGEHWHVVRKFGTSIQEVYKWGELVEDVKSQTNRERGVKEVTKLKTNTFDVFKSASVHTIKARIPWKLWALPALFVFGLLLAYWAFLLLRPDDAAAGVAQGDAAGLPAAPPGATSLSGSGRAKPELTLEQYLERLAMRAPGLHGSQPVFDDREVRAEPRTFCVMSGGDNGDEQCRCYTEQATRLFDVRDDVCRHMARWGGYDPFLAPLEGRPAEYGEEASQRRPGAPAGIRTEPGQVGSSAMGEVWGRHPETLRADWGS